MAPVLDDVRGWAPNEKARYRWRRQSRPEQRPPSGAWSTWLILAGRGFGKTRAGAEWIGAEAQRFPGSRWAVVAPTFADARDTCVEGESGLLSVLPSVVATWNRSIGELILTNGSRIKLFSGDEPDRLRGPQHHGAWCDELAAWRYPEAWDQLQFGLRLGAQPRSVVTTTPKPTPLIRDLLGRDSTAVTRGSTFDNAANLAPAALEELRRRYEGTRLGRQELYAELLDDIEGALWNRAMLDKGRLSSLFDPDTVRGFVRVVVAVDPAVTSGEHSDETGIIVAGLGGNGDGYVLADLTCRDTPDSWARKAVGAFEVHNADRIIAEVNNGGDMVAHTIRTVDANVAVRTVHATRGKRLRAEPVAALYEQGRIHHVGAFPELEDQLCGWTPDTKDSPDRLDALVWAITELMVTDRPSGVSSYRNAALRGRR